MKPLGSPNTKTNRMYEVDKLIITEHQSKSLKCEVKPDERNEYSTNTKTNRIDELNRRKLNTYDEVFEVQL